MSWRAITLSLENVALPSISFSDTALQRPAPLSASHSSSLSSHKFEEPARSSSVTVLKEHTWLKWDNK